MEKDSESHARPTAQPSRVGAPRSRRRRHAAARSRVVAGALSVATFLGLGANMAVKAAGATTAATSTSTQSSTSSSASSSNSSSESSANANSSSNPSWFGHVQLIHDRSAGCEYEPWKLSRGSGRWAPTST